MNRWLATEVSGKNKIDVTPENFLHSFDTVKRAELLQMIPCATRVSEIHEAFIPRNLRNSRFNTVNSFAKMERLINIVGQSSALMVPRYFRDFYVMQHADFTDGFLAFYAALFDSQGRSVFMQTNALLAQNYASGASMLRDDHATFLTLFRDYSGYHFGGRSRDQKQFLDNAAAFYAKLSAATILHENEIGNMQHDTEVFLDGMRNTTIPVITSLMRVSYKEGEYAKWYSEFSIGICVLYCALSAMRTLGQVVSTLYKYNAHDIRRVQDDDLRGTIRNLLSHGATRVAYTEHAEDVLNHRYAALDAIFDELRDVYLEHQARVRIGNKTGIDIACAIVGIYSLLRALEPVLESLFISFNKDEPVTMLAQASYENYAMGEFMNNNRVYTLALMARNAITGERHLEFGETQEEAGAGLLELIGKLRLIPMPELYKNTVAVTSVEDQKEIRAREDFPIIAPLIKMCIDARDDRYAYCVSTDAIFDVLREMFPQVDNVQSNLPHETILDASYTNELSETANRLSLIGNSVSGDFRFSRELISGLIGELTYVAPGVVDVVLSLMRLGKGSPRECRQENLRNTISRDDLDALKIQAQAAVEKWLCSPAIMTTAGSSGMF